MPLSLIEAMSAGLPWIATDRGGTRELMQASSCSEIVSHEASLAELRAAFERCVARIRSNQASRASQRAAYESRFLPSAVGDLWVAEFFSKGVA
jgi:glycosyltransferase involved in cell wall biosynthesis